MTSIIDRRKTNKNKSVGNRKKFIDRNKDRIKAYINKKLSNKSIADMDKDREIILNDVQEPSFNFDPKKGKKNHVVTGNKTLKKGDRVYYPSKSKEEGTDGSDAGDGLDNFAFTLSKEEFYELYFSDLKLPNFIKESLAGTHKYKLQRTGYSKEGIPARLDLVKTLKQALARRIATGSNRYLDDIDLRYKHFTKKPYPVRQAVMILLMDVSASMGEYEKSLAKKFFLLLYLFLNKVYSEVKVIFISHTQAAQEVTEQEFFYGTKTGGTIVSSGLNLVNEIITTRIDTSSVNVYIAQASDGDNWAGDTVCREILESILNKVQYFAYIQTETSDRRQFKEAIGAGDLMDIYTKVNNKKLQARYVTAPEEVYPTLRELFEGD